MSPPTRINAKTHRSGWRKPHDPRQTRPLAPDHAHHSVIWRSGRSGRIRTGNLRLIQRLPSINRPRYRLSYAPDSMKWSAIPVPPRGSLVGSEESWLLDEWRARRKWRLRRDSHPREAGCSRRPSCSATESDSVFRKWNLGWPTGFAPVPSPSQGEMLTDTPWPTSKGLVLPAGTAPASAD